MKPDMTHLTSCRNVFSGEHTDSTSAVFGFFIILPFRKREKFYTVQNKSSHQIRVRRQSKDEFNFFSASFDNPVTVAVHSIACNDRHSDFR